jgi:hypothetical protein
MPQSPPAPTSKGEAPIGSSPITGPTPNKGFEAAALQRAGVIVKQLMDLLNMTGPTSDLGKDILKVLGIINKHVPSGSVTPAAEKSQLQNMAMKNTQSNQQMQALKQQQGGAGGAGAPGGAGGAGGGQAQQAMAA